MSALGLPQNQPITTAMREFPDFGQPSPAFSKNPGRKLLMKHRLRGAAAQAIPENHSALATYLHKEQDLGLVEDILTPFETKNPLSLEHPEMFTIEMRNLCQPVDDSIHYLKELFTTITIKKPFLDGYKFACFPLILSRWTSILGWLQTLLWIRYANYRGSLDDAGNDFFRGFGVVVASYLGTDCGEELYSIPSTIDFLFFALRQLDFWKGKRIGNETSYIILDVIGDSLQSDATTTVLSSRFETLSKAARRGIVSSLLSRVKDFSDPRAELEIWAPDVISVVARITNALVDTNPYALKLFRQQNFYVLYSSALCNLVKKAIRTNYGDDKFWGFVAAGAVNIYVTTALSPDRGNAIAAAVEAGLLFCGFTCLQRYPGASHEVREAFDRAKGAMDDMCHRYMCISRVYSAVKKWHPQLEALLPTLKQLKGLDQLCSVYPESFSQSSMAFTDRPGIPVPCNYDIIHAQNPDGALKTCSSCHSVVYCSAACQEKDWLRFHKFECPKRTRVYIDQRSDNNWASRQMRRDRLAYINLLLNGLLNASFARDPRISLEPMRISTFDLRTYVGIGVAKFSVPEWQSLAWNLGSDAEVWLPRCESFIKDMKTDNTIRIVEFVFFNDSINVEVVLVKVQEKFGREAGLSVPRRYYSVLSTISRICPTRAVQDMWQNKPDGTILVVHSTAQVPG